MSNEKVSCAFPDEIETVIEEMKNRKQPHQWSSERAMQYFNRKKE